MSVTDDGPSRVTQRAPTRDAFAAALADASPALIAYIDAEGYFRFANRAHEARFGLPRDKIEGRLLREVVGDAAHARMRPFLDRALSGEPVLYEGQMAFEMAGLLHVEARFTPDFADTGAVRGFHLMVADTASRHVNEAQLSRLLHQERRRTALLDLAHQLRDATDARVIANLACEVMASQLGAPRAGFAEVDADGVEALIVGEWVAEGFRPIAGSHQRLDDFGPGMVADLKAGRQIIIPDPVKDPRTKAQDVQAAYKALRIGAALTSPLVKGRRMAAYIYACQDVARDWKPDEVAFVADVAELIWTARERARADQALQRAEETERLLIREVDHRAKNVLAVVQSLAQLTPFHSKDQYVEALAGRIGSLARAHSLLSNARWSGVDLHDLLRLELDAYRCDGTEQLIIDGPPALIDAQAAQSLALVIHELATNASKYGALARPEGRLSVTWRWGDDGALHLAWRETAGVRIAPPQRRGFGSTLIESAVKQAAARVALDWRPEGLEVRLDIPTGAQARAAESVPAYRPGLVVDDSPALRDQRVLIVEDEAVVAMELARVLTAAGAKVVGPAGTIEEALELLDGQPIDRALLDVNLGGRLITPVAAALTDRRIPFVYLTGYQEPDVDDGPILRKPVATSALLGALARGAATSVQ